jgi:hypothetical protein
MAEEARPEIVLCGRTECMHCIKMKEGIPIEQTREPGFVPAWPTILQHKCDRKNIVVDVEGNCYSFMHHHPDIMRPAGIRAKGQPSNSVLGIPEPRYPTADERAQWVYTLRRDVISGKSPSVDGILIALKDAYLMGREDEKLGVRVDK